MTATSSSPTAPSARRTPAPENAEVRDVRCELKTKINVFDRIVQAGHFGHNKFVVFCDSDRNPQRVLTGSTNWTTIGLCTQANNGLIIDDPNVAGDFLTLGSASRPPATITRRNCNRQLHRQ